MNQMHKFVDAVPPGSTILRELEEKVFPFLHVDAVNMRLARMLDPKHLTVHVVGSGDCAHVCIVLLLLLSRDHCRSLVITSVIRVGTTRHRTGAERDRAGSDQCKCAIDYVPAPWRRGAGQKVDVIVGATSTGRATPAVSVGQQRSSGGERTSAGW
jgi:hypothetical protein